MLARNIMDTWFHIINPGNTIADAVKSFQKTSQAEKVDALRQMLARDVQRLFVHDGKPENIIGVLSLSDAARFRSGTCRACMPSRVMTG